VLVGVTVCTWSAFEVPTYKCSSYVNVRKVVRSDYRCMTFCVFIWIPYLFGAIQVVVFTVYVVFHWFLFLGIKNVQVYRLDIGDNMNRLNFHMRVTFILRFCSFSLVSIYLFMFPLFRNADGFWNLFEVFPRSILRYPGNLAMLLSFLNLSFFSH
jgi:hypothetical protein